MLLLFLGSVGPAVIVTYSVPLSIITTVILVCFAKVALGVVSVSKLVLNVNVLISGSVIIVRGVCHLHTRNCSVQGTTMRKSGRIANTVVTSALAAVDICTPVVFARKVAQRLFISLTLAVTCALMTDLIITLAFIPTVTSIALEGAGSVHRP